MEKFNKNIKITDDERVKLYNEVWEEPVSIVATRYNISDVGLRKHLQRLGIPLPPRGYWEKLKAGQIVEKTQLPKVFGEIRQYVRNYIIKYKKDIEKFTTEELKSGGELCLLSDATINILKDVCLNVEVENRLRNPDKLIVEHIEQIEVRKKHDKEKKAVGKHIIKDNQNEAQHPILPINVSKDNINRAYKIIDCMIKIINELEGHVSTYKYENKDSAYFYVFYVDFKFELYEEKNKTQNNLVLKLEARKRNYWANDEYKQIYFKDEMEKALEQKIGLILYEMFVIANNFECQYELKKREEDRKREERRLQENLEYIRKGELEDIKILSKLATDWNMAKSIRDFIEQSKVCLKEMDEGHQKIKLTEWIKWAERKADWIDPLIQCEDRLLGKSQYILNIIDNTKINFENNEEDDGFFKI